MASRIRITDGSTVSDSWDYRRSEQVIRGLEQEYSLTPVPSSDALENRSPTTGEMRRLWRTGDAGVRRQLVDHIEAAAEGTPTLPQLMERLNETGVDVRVSDTRTGAVKGISYALEGVAFSGTKLGKAYTFPGLQTYRGVQYSPEMRAAVRQATERPPATAEQRRMLQQERVNEIAPLLARLLSEANTPRLQTRTSLIQWHPEESLLTMTQGEQIVVQAEWDGAGWQDRGSHLTREEVERIQAIGERYLQVQAQARRPRDRSVDLER